MIALASGDKKFLDMREGYFRGAGLPFACLAGADFGGANFEGTNFYSANMYGSALTRVKFSGSNLAGIDLRAADIGQSIFGDGQNFSDYLLKRYPSIRTDISGAMICSASMDKTNFSRAILSGTSFDDAYGEQLLMDKSCLFNVSFKGVTLTNSNFIGADARCSVFERSFGNETKLENVNFSFSNLKGANFRGVNLKAATFFGANLAKADLTGAEIIKGTLVGAYLCKTIGPEGADAPRLGDADCNPDGWKQPPEFLACTSYEKRGKAPPEAPCNDPTLPPRAQCYPESWLARARSAFSKR